MTDAYPPTPATRDILVGGPGAPAGATPAAPGPAGARRARPLLLLLAVLLVLLAAGGTFAYSTLSGGGPQPESVAPADAVAFLKVDLNPSAAQKINAYRLIHAFPATHGKSDGDLRSEVVKAVLDDPKGLDYARDVKPWAGQRAGVAGVRDADGSVHAVRFLAVTDAGKATASLARLRERGAVRGFTVRRGFAVLADTQAQADAASAAGAAHPLAADPRFRGDVARLDGGQIGLAWVDLPAVADLARHAAAARLGNAAASIPNLGTVTGRLVVGLHARSDAFELVGRLVGGTASPAGPDVASLVTGLPAGTLAAAGFALPPSFGAGLAAGLGPAARSLSRLGLSLDDVLSLLGTRTVVALGALPASGRLPLVAVRTTPRDPVSAARAVRAFQALAARGGTPLAVRQAAGDTVIASDEGYAAAVAAEGTLGHAELFRAAVGPLPEHTSAAGFVDVARVLQAPSVKAADRDKARPVKAVGFAVGRSHGELELRVRVVIR